MTEELLEKILREVREVKIPGDPVIRAPMLIFEFYCQELDQVLMVTIRKIPLCFQQGRRN